MVDTFFCLSNAEVRSCNKAPKSTALFECVESIYVKITETACVSDELCRLLKEEEEEVLQILNLADSCIKRVFNHANS